MPRALSQLALLLLGALVLTGCGQKGPLCLQEPKPTAVAATAPAAPADSSAPTPAATSPAAASTSTPYRPVVPGYTRCR